MAKKSKSTMWVGGAILYSPEPDVSTTTSEVIELIPAVLAADPVGVLTKYTIQAIYLHFSIRRINIAETQALGFLVYQTGVTEGANTPVQALDALSLEERFYGNRAILMMAPLPVPFINHSGDLATAQVTEQVLTSHHEFQASRKHDRSNTVLAMTLNSETLAVSVFSQWRILLEY